MIYSYTYRCIDMFQRIYKYIILCTNSFNKFISNLIVLDDALKLINYNYMIHSLILFVSLLNCKDLIQKPQEYGHFGL